MTMQISSYEDTQLDAVEIPADAPKFEDKNTTVTIGETTGELTKKTLFLQLSFSLLAVSVLRKAQNRTSRPRQTSNC